MRARCTVNLERLNHTVLRHDPVELNEGELPFGCPRIVVVDGATKRARIRGDLAVLEDVKAADRRC